MSLRDRIFAMEDLPRKPVVVPEWEGVTVYVRTLTAAEVDRYLSMANKIDDNFRAKVAVLTVVDEHGNQEFTEKDVEALGKKNSHALQRITNAALELNRFDAASIDEVEKKTQG